MSDKDFIKRESFCAYFPEAELAICLYYYALRTFHKKITCENMDITSAERNRGLEIIQSITYSKSEALFKENVIDYFMENWDCIKEQWVIY